MKKREIKSRHIQSLVFAAVFAALIFVATAIFPFPLPGGGYANLGDAFVMCGAFFLGPVWGFFAGAIGSALSDLFLGYAVYAPATFIIKGLMAVVFALVCRRHMDKALPARVLILALSGALSECVMVIGYFLFECVLYGSPTAAADIVGNLVQAAVGIAAGVCALVALSANKKVLRSVIGGQRPAADRR